jgi:hypothetical protein
MQGLEALRDAAFNYIGIVVALFVAQVSTFTAVGAFVLLLLKIIVELPKAWAVIKRQRVPTSDKTSE